MQRIYPWLVAALVLIPALMAWQLQHAQRASDLERFRRALSLQSPSLTAASGPCQEIANQVMNHLTRGGAWEGLEPILGEWRLRAPAAVGYGYAERIEDRLELKQLTLGDSESRHETGADLLTLPAVRDGWEDLLRRGGGSATMPLPMLRDDPRPLLLVLRPVYRPGEYPRTEAARRTAARGAAFCVMDQERVWSEGVQRLDRRTLNVERMPDTAALKKNDFDRVISLGIGGAFEWKARFTPGPDFFDRQNRHSPALVAMVGLVLAGVTFMLARNQARQRDEIETLNRGLDARVAALTEELRDENARLRAAQAETERALDREREAGELKSRVVATISHEFRTPLSIILSSAEILRHYADRLAPAERTGHLAAIEGAVNGMSTLIQSVLAFSKAGAGRLEFRPERQAPEDLLIEVVDEVQSATSRRCPITLDMHRLDEPGWFDATLLRLILVNLLGNAVKYSPPGSPVSLQARREKDRLVLHVIDRGIGIQPEDRPRLFQSFRRGGNTQGIPGTGLGLSIVKTCVELHLGNIDVGGSSEAGGGAGIGTTFTVTLPAYAEPPPHTESVPPFQPATDPTPET